jgi:glycosyltransferase involved in cell wall biosynthesis
VLCQGIENLQVIVVDDGSTDGSVQALSPFRGRIEVIEQANRGPAAARNRGVEASRGTHVAFLDADDWWHSGRLAAQLAALGQFPQAGVSITDFSVDDSRGRIRERAGIRWKYRLVRDERETPWDLLFSERRVVHWRSPDGAIHEATAHFGEIGEWLFRGNFFNTSSVLVRRDALLKVGGFDVSLDTEEDYDCWLKITRESPVVFVDAPLVAFRKRPDQLTRPDQLERVIRNALLVVRRAAHEAPISLGSALVRKRLATLERDLGIVCLRTRRNSEARDHLSKSIRLSPCQLPVLALLIAAYLPPGILGGIEGLRRSLGAVRAGHRCRAPE